MKQPNPLPVKKKLALLLINGKGEKDRVFKLNMKISILLCFLLCGVKSVEQTMDESKFKTLVLNYVDKPPMTIGYNINVNWYFTKKFHENKEKIFSTIGQREDRNLRAYFVIPLNIYKKKQ